MPAWKRLTAAQQERILKCPLADLQAVADDLQTSYAVALYNRSKALQPVAAGKTSTLAPSPLLEGDALIISDVHIPRHDATFAQRVLDLAAAWGLENCVVAGDLLDGNGASPWAPELPTPTTQDEIDGAGSFLGRLCEQFLRVWCLTGNHDAWLLKKALQMLGLKADLLYKFLDADGRVTWRPYHWGDVISGGQRWRIEHPKNASVSPGSVGGDLASKFLCNVVVAHGHTVGYRRDRSGRFTIIDSGGLFHLDKLPYVSLEHSRRPAMNQGAVIIHRGIGYLLDPLNIDWEAMAWLGRRMAK